MVLARARVDAVVEMQAIATEATSGKRGRVVNGSDGSVIGQHRSSLRILQITSTVNRWFIDSEKVRQVLTMSSDKMLNLVNRNHSEFFGLEKGSL